METTETTTLDRRAQQRLSVLNHVLADELIVEAAAQILELSIRQGQPSDRPHAHGPAALANGERLR